MAIVIDPDDANEKRMVLLSCLTSVWGGCCDQDQPV